MKSGAMVAVLLLLFGVVSYAPVLNAQEDDEVVVDDKGEKYAIKKEKLPYFNELKGISHKEILTEGDYKRIRVLLEKFADIKISDKDWEGLREYIDAEHGKWLYFEKRKALKKSQQGGTQVSSPNPAILAISSSDYLPIFRQPWVDINGQLFPTFLGSNDLLKGYHYSYAVSGGYKIEITAVFKDEDHPDLALDLAYDAYRLAQNGRIEDIETFYINTDSNGNPQSIYFDYGGTGTYSGTQEFFDWFPDHITATVQASDFSWSGKRAYIYINTWNHLYGEDDNNPTLSDKTWSTYASAQGTREDAEADF